MIVVNDELTLLDHRARETWCSPPTASSASAPAGNTRWPRRQGACPSTRSCPATEIVRESLQIAAEIDVYTNDNIVVEELKCAK